MTFTQTINEVATISVPGEFTSMKCKNVKLDFDTAIQTGCTKVVIDFINTTKLDSRAQQLLTMIRKQIKADNFSVINVSGQPLTLLNSTNCEDWIK